MVTLHIRGDEYFNWLEDTDGYSVVKSKGNYVYARLTGNNTLGPSAHIVGKANPAALGLDKHVIPPPGILKSRRSEMQAVGVSGVSGTGPGVAAAASIAPTGQIPNLVVMIRFSNHAGRVLPDAADISVLFNAVGGDPALAPTGSVRDVYLENSYGQLDLQSTPTGWIDVSQTEAYYANGVSGLGSRIWEALIEALDSIDTSINFSDYDTDNDGYIDAITFIHSGYGAEWGGVDADGADYTDRIWSHKWQLFPDWVSDEGVRVSLYDINPALWQTSGSAIGRVGVIAHETGHFFGLPDLYDTDYSGNGIGSYGLMANSWGFDNTQYHPPHLSAWSKIALGWVTPTPVSGPGTYNLLQAETNPDVIRIDNGFPSGEYLLLENRQPTGTESVMPQGGLAIWHIDESTANNDQEGYPGQAGWPENGTHYRVALLQADGNYDLEHGNNRGDAGDVFHAAGNSAIGAATVPGTNTYQGGVIATTGVELNNITGAAASMSFTYAGIASVPAPTFVFPAGGETLAAGISVDVTWNQNAAPVTPYFSDDMESGSGLWSASHGSGVFDWTLEPANAHSGSYAWFAADPATVADQYLASIGPVQVPAGGQIGFWHSFDTEPGYDGGVVEISTDNENWTDLGPEMTQNGYSSVISNCCGNPLGGRKAFSGSSGGYIETLADLSDYSGQAVYIRFRMASDSSTAGNGWYLDDASLHTPITSYSLEYTNNCSPDVFISDDMESGAGLWSVSHAAGALDWTLGTDSPRSGSYAWSATEPASVSDQYLASAGPVPIPDNGQISFWHSYDTESVYDGGVVEVSTDNVNWTDLGPDMTQNGYNSVISSCCGNPVGGRSAFSGDSGGYIETLIDMSGYAGQSVYLRFRMASDSSIAMNGWHLDDVSLFVDTAPAWTPVGSTGPGASRQPWPVPLTIGDDYCLRIVGTAPGNADSAAVQTDPFSIIDADSDGDGLLNIYEITVLGTSPGSVDTDGDGLVDGSGGVVVLAALPGGIDENGDGYVDGEADYGTDPVFSNVGDVAPRGSPDNLVNLGDLVVLSRLVTGAIQPGALESALGDTNNDGRIDTADLLLMQQSILGGSAP